MLASLSCGGAAEPSASAHGARASSQRLSPASHELGPSPFPLAGVGTAPDAFPLTFRHPPHAALLFDLHSGRVLWQRNALARRGIASLTKMMTALIAVGAEPPGARVLIHEDDVEASGSKVGVLPLGRHVRLESMLYGLMLPSGNDAAAALAERVSGSIRDFVVLMNQTAARFGLACTHFTSPSGFIDAGNYSCAADLAVLAHLVLEQPRLARIVRTYYAVIPFPIKGGRLYIYNNNPLLHYHFPGLTGLKTGFTEAAGRCLVATATRHGVSLGVVLLGSPAPANQARKLLDGAFEHVYGQKLPDEEPMPPSA
jgi:D-alanyl-D-alanine carboxypeptidase (penicillin-binding protein 5/6)